MIAGAPPIFRGRETSLERALADVVAARSAIADRRRRSIERATAFLAASLLDDESVVSLSPIPLLGRDRRPILARPICAAWRALAGTAGSAPEGGAERHFGFEAALIPHRGDIYAAAITQHPEWAEPWVSSAGLELLPISSEDGPSLLFSRASWPGIDPPDARSAEQTFRILGVRAWVADRSPERPDAQRILEAMPSFAERLSRTTRALIRDAAIARSLGLIDDATQPPRDHERDRDITSIMDAMEDALDSDRGRTEWTEMERRVEGLLVRRPTLDDM